MDDGAVPVRLAALALAVVISACAPAQQGGVALAELQPCDQLELGEGLIPNQCKLQAAGQTLRVSYGEPAAGTSVGTVNVDVHSEDGSVQQSIVEADVLQYLPVSVEDIDGDGRADIRIERDRGNVNTTSALWIFNGERGRYERAGEVSGVEIERTADGYIAVPARSSAAAWNVSFYRLSDIGLAKLVAVEVVGEERAGGAIESTCSLVESNGLPAIALSETEAREKFCAEPAAQVFSP